MEGVRERGGGYLLVILDIFTSRKFHFAKTRIQKVKGLDVYHIATSLTFVFQLVTAARLLSTINKFIMISSTKGHQFRV